MALKNISTISDISKLHSLKKLPLAQFSKTIKDVLNPTETHMHKINNSHTLHKRFFFSPAYLKKCGAIKGK